MKRTAIPKRRSQARRGRVRDPHFMAFCHRTFGCQVAHSGGCGGALTFHHVKHGWDQKDDTRGLMLCFNHHEHDGGPDALERMGRVKWQERHRINIELQVQMNQQAYEEAGGVLVGA